MATFFHSSARGQRYIFRLALLLSFFVLADYAGAQDTTPERSNLAAILRQLDAIERIAAQEATRSPNPQNRYHFDYTRLRADIERIRHGIDDYLTPPRAQPRDPEKLVGEYRQVSEEETP